MLPKMIYFGQFREQSDNNNNNDNNNWLYLSVNVFSALALIVDTFQARIGIWKSWFWGEGKTGVPGEKPLGAEKRTNNKLNPQMTCSICYFDDYIRPKQKKIFICW